MQYLLSDHKGSKQKINMRKISGKSQNTWRLNNTCLDSTWIKKEISGEILKYFELNENKIQLSKIWGMQ